MTTARATARARATATTAVGNLPYLVGALVVGLLLFYVLGFDEGATSLFGNTMVVHEFVHDARHVLGFPCH
ncbi:CbtB domain-containing protein [Actinomycetospora sp. TBRC 11914]|uniref:CbtB domain-containing protein n=1 Tax=Actinomycetospora sp. TBRC 11914 TaxID=2729387 RepID=UPI00145C979B|nr:CbtB domain-containing protein [Actinomycetospora sp. TBRC 11914]NMO91333.1 CbtB-domain containing protein [Actinomycetospora sp. TBRC 11914]